ncbi:MAG: hypothetical protein Q4B65_00715 [Candidatus Saccharibacteria bacterium]|nr:hypothetical protein [Candidatus Saccharibacteria bacterium]
MKNPRLIIPNNIKPAPTRAELEVAQLLARHFSADARFIVRMNCKTPDFLINGVEWELKSPTGGGKRNIQHQFQKGLLQSKYLAIDLRRSKIHISKSLREIDFQFRKTRGIKGLIVIKKDGTVLELKK